MNPNAEDTHLARWLDGELPPAERSAFEARLASDPAMQSAADALLSLRSSLQQAYPAVREMPHADFFNSQIMAAIGQPEARQQPRTSWWQSLWSRQPWIIGTAVAACAVLAAGTLWRSPEQTVVLSIYAPNPSVQATTRFSSEAQATVLMLDGLESIPADRQVTGYKVHRSETDSEVAMTTLFSDQGEVLLVLATDAKNQPRLIAH
jgi:anti-sigma factor RsiW